MSILTLSITLTPLMLNTSDSTIDRDKQLGGIDDECRRKSLGKKRRNIN